MIRLSQSLIDSKTIRETVKQKSQKNAILNFEKSFCGNFGLASGVATSSGRAALILALKAAKIGPGDKILVQSLICSTVIDAILSIGVEPVLVDSDLATFNVSYKDLSSKIDQQPKAILVAHLYGVPAQIEEIKNLAQKHHIVLIEDCAQTLGTKINHRFLGTYGDMSIYSFGLKKQITAGTGGFLGINNPKLIRAVKTQAKKEKQTPLAIERKELVVLIKDQNQNPEKLGILANPYIRQAGFMFEQMIVKFWPFAQYKKIFFKNLLMNQLKAKYLSGMLQIWPKDSLARRKNAEFLLQNIQDRLWQKPKFTPKTISVPLCLAVLNKTKLSQAEIMSRAAKEGLEIGNLIWPRPVHQKLKYASIFRFGRKSLTQSENLARRLINLPVHAALTHKDCQKIVNFLNNL